jgi:peptidyl-prolyl cis-trans isomerase D
MLSFFRQRGLSSVLYGAIIIATILTFVIEFRPSAGRRTASLNETCAARIGGRCIDPKDFSSAYRILMPSRSAQQSRRMNLRRVALDGLIERELLNSEAKRLGISVSDDEVTDQLYAGFIRVSVPAADPTVAQTILQEMYQSYARAGLISPEVATSQLGARDAAIPVDFQDPKTKRFDIKTYERKVRNLSNRSTTEFREEQARELLAAKMRDVVRDPVRVSPSEAWQEYDRRYSTATVTTIAVKESWAGRWAVEATPADTLAWVKDNQAAFDAALQERLGQDTPKGGRIRQILVKLAYGATPEEKAAALSKLSWAAARVRGGKPFAEVARDVSDDAATASSGGDVGEKTDAFGGAFKAAASSLKPGETMAGAVETQFGFHLITRDDPAKAAELESQLKASLSRSLFVKARATDAAKRVAQSIASAIRSGKTADQAIGDAVSSLVRKGRVEPLRVVSMPVTTEGDAGPLGAPPASSGSLKLTINQPFDSATDPDHPQAQTSTAFNRGGDPFPGLSPDGTTAVVTFAFSSAAGAVMAEPVRTVDAFVVVELKDGRQATREEFDKNRETIELEMVQAKRDEALSLYVKRLRDRSKDVIKIDASYVEESKGAGPAGEDEEEDL